MNLIPVIGLEIHVQLKTKSKMFCSCTNSLGEAQPNTYICPICMGYPGTLPVPNKQAIEWIQKAGVALGCELAQDSKFDRKSYFYPDLPKGYQISQFDKPFCLQGSFPLMVNGEERVIGITRIHLEEDAAKNSHSKDGASTLVDYNRAGTPLMEIVTEPDFKTPEEAKIFLQELQRAMRALGISDADMEKGQMRCDANISLREEGETTLHPKTEIKNVNSFKFVEKALLFEIERQKKMWESGETPNHATRGWNSETGKTEEQRIKEEAADYRYFPEPDIPPFHFTIEELGEIKASIPEMPWQARSRFMKEYGTSEADVNLLLGNDELSHLYEDTASEIAQADLDRADIVPAEEADLMRLSANIILNDVRAVRGDSATDPLRITPENLSELVVLVHQGKIGSNVIRQVLTEMQRTGGDPDPIIENLGLAQVSNENELEEVIAHVISENPDVVEKIKAGKEAGLQYLMGQVMAKTQGKANPGIVIELLKKNIQ
jgi:aspartyl-tRNA(Asn)/glutamyl-tRNA(Gln) amidotransferase subunit B